MEAQDVIPKISAYHRWVKVRLENDPEFREKIFTRIAEYNKKRYNTDDNYKLSEQERLRKISKERYDNDPEYRERKKEQSRMYQQKKRLLKLQQQQNS